MTATAPTLAPNPSAPLLRVQVPTWLQTMRAIVNPIPYLENAHAEHGDIFEGRSLGFPPPLSSLIIPTPLNRSLPPTPICLTA